MLRWLARYTVVLVVVGVVAVVIATAGEEPATETPPPDDSATSSTTTSTSSTTEPPIFSPLPDSDQVPAIRTPTGVVLPVTGGEPGAWQVTTPCSNTAVVAGETVRGAHVVLDPGHGGEEPGAVGPSGQTEKEINLDIAHRVAERLRAEGATVVLTRDDDIRVTLATRAALATALDPIAFVSIHHNAAPESHGPSPGSELYHHLNDAESKRLAGLLWEEFQAALSPFGAEWAVGDDPGARARQSVRTGDDFYGVLRRSQGVSAVLTEAVFLSDPEEDALLATDEFREAEAEAISRAIIRFATSDDPGSGYVATKVSDAPAGGGGGPQGCEDPPLS